VLIWICGGTDQACTLEFIQLLFARKSTGVSPYSSYLSIVDETMKDTVARFEAELF